MLDVKLIREQPDLVRERLASRGAGDEGKVAEVLRLDEKRRKTIGEVERLKAERNRVSKEIGVLLSQKKGEEAEAKKNETRRIGDQIAELDRQAAEVESARDDLLLRLPNLPHSSVAIGRTAADNPVVQVWGEKSKFSFKPRTHIDLCESLELVDFQRGAKLSGSGFLLYKGWGAKLERAPDDERPLTERGIKHADVHHQARLHGGRGPISEI